MKCFILSFTFVLAFVCEESSAQGLYSSFRLNQSLRFLNKGNIERAQTRMQQNPERVTWRARSKVQRKYIDLSIMTLGIDVNLLSSDSLKSLIREYDNFFQDWVQLGSDTATLIAKGVAPRNFRNLCSQAQNRCFKIISDSILAAENQRKLDSILVENQRRMDSVSQQLLIKKGLEDPEIIREVAEEWSQVNDSFEFEPGPGESSAEAIMEVYQDGTNLWFTLTVLYADDLYGFEKGHYKSSPIDYRIWRFCNTVKSRVNTQIVANVTIIGEADSYVPGGRKYLGEFGKVNWKEYDLYPGQVITNGEIAFLRAYNAKRVFQEKSGLPVKELMVIDHRPREGLYGGKYRKVEIRVCFLDYFKGQLDSLALPVRQTVVLGNKSFRIHKNSVHYGK